MRVSINIKDLLSKHLFWDVDISSIDLEKHSKYVISKVLQYGFYSDWLYIVDYYGIDFIVKTAKKIRDLDKKTVSFLSVMGNVSKSEFQCYTTKQSVPQHWNF